MNDHLSVSWFAHNSNLVETISDLYHKNVFCDVTVVCEGKYFPLHKLILCSQSEYFRELLEKAQCKHPFIILRDTTAQDFAALMQFIYKGSVEVPRERVSLLMKAGDDMKIKGLYTSENNEVRYFSQIEEEITSYTPPESSFSVSSNEHNLNKPSQENYHIFDEAMPTNTLASNENVSLSTNDVQPIIAVKKESLLQERTSHQRKRRSVGASESINDKAEVLKIPNVVIESCPEAIHLAKRLKTSVSSEIEIIEQEKNHPVTSTASPSSLLVLPKLVTATSSEVETEDGEDQSTTSGRVSVENTSEQGEKTTVDEILPFPPAVTVNEIAADIKMEDSFLDFSNEIDFDFEESKDEPSLAASAVPLEQPVLPSIPSSNLPSTNVDSNLPIEAVTSDPLIIAEKKNSANTAQNEPRKSCRRKLGETHFPEGTCKCGDPKRPSRLCGKLKKSIVPRHSNTVGKSDDIKMLNPSSSKQANLFGVRVIRARLINKEDRRLLLKNGCQETKFNVERQTKHSNRKKCKESSRLLLKNGCQETKSNVERQTKHSNMKKCTVCQRVFPPELFPIDQKCCGQLKKREKRFKTTKVVAKSESLLREKDLSEVVFTPEFQKDILDRFKNDEIGVMCRTDPLIKYIWYYFYLKNNENVANNLRIEPQNRTRYVMTQMRSISKFLLNFRKIVGKRVTLQEILHPRYLNPFKEAVTMTVGIPNSKWQHQFGNMIKRVSQILQRRLKCLGREDEGYEMAQFIKVLNNPITWGPLFGNQMKKKHRTRK